MNVETTFNVLNIQEDFAESLLSFRLHSTCAVKTPRLQHFDQKRRESYKLKPFYDSEEVSSDYALLAKGHLALIRAQHTFRVGCLCHLILVKFSFPVVCSFLKCEVMNLRRLKFFN